MIAAAYTRVSTPDQSCLMQRTELRAYCHLSYAHDERPAR